MSATISAGPDHHHHTPTAKAAAARAQRDAAVIGWIDGEPIPRTLLDARLSTLRNGPRAGVLPIVGSSEDRQLVRWTAQVLFTEEICRREAARRNLTAGTIALDAIGAVQLGSINTAAWQSCVEVRAVFATVTADAGPPIAATAGLTRWWRLRHAMAPTRDGAAREPLRPMGWTTLQDLPEPLTRALRGAELGETIGPVESSLGWHLAVADETDDRPTEVDSTARQRLGERLREFARWLDYQRGTHLRCAEGFEHPGDPSQPDNTHRH